MHVGALLLLAVGLAMDAMAVAASRGLAVPHVRPRHVLMVAGLFGGFQALMPLLGWLLGSHFGHYVEAWDHWIAFGLLTILGGKLLLEAWRGGDEPPPGDPFAWRLMLPLAVATSIDALAAGLTLPLLETPLVVSLATIGVVTALLSAIGLYAGRHLGAALGRRLDVIGGLALIAVGARILYEHLSV